MANSTANRIYMAILSHTAWKKRLHDAIETGETEYDPDPTHCEFGKWLQNNEAELGQYEQYANIAQLHEQFHDEAKKIVALAVVGQKEEALIAMAYGSEFEKISQKLVHLIIAWHDEVK
jgi:hypothetical protein